MPTDLTDAIAGLLYRATATLDGFMSAPDKVKLDNLGPSLIAVNTATAAAMPAYAYLNGAAGVGATMTFAAGPATIDGIAQANGMTFLQQHGASRADNGVYRWTTYASGGASVATRVPGFDTAATIPGGKIAVRQGIRRGGSRHTHRNRGAIIMGVTGIFYHSEEPGAEYGRRYITDFAAGATVTASTSNNFGGDVTGIAIGTGSACGAVPSTVAPLRIADGIPVNSATVFGLWGCSTGTTATGYAGLLDGLYATQTLTPEGGGAFIITQDIGFTFEVRVMVQALSTGAQEFAINCGLVADRSNGQKLSTNTVGVNYDRTGVATTKWLAVAAAAGVSTGTATDTGVTVTAQQFYIIEIHKDIGANDIMCSIDRSVVATYSTNIPTTLVTFQSMIYSSVGATPKGYVHDWFKVDFQTPQGRV